MTRAPLVSVEVVERGMGAGGVVRSVSDKMGTTSIAAELGGVRGRQGIPALSTPETVMRELAEPLELQCIRHYWRSVLGVPCM